MNNDVREGRRRKSNREFVKKCKMMGKGDILLVLEGCQKLSSIGACAPKAF